MDKRRTALGTKKNGGTTTDLRLQNTTSNLHIEKCQNLDLDREGTFLRNFDLGEETLRSARAATPQGKRPRERGAR